MIEQMIALIGIVLMVWGVAWIRRPTASYDRRLSAALRRTYKFALDKRMILVGVDWATGDSSTVVTTKPDTELNRKKILEILQGLKNVDGRAPIEIESTQGTSRTTPLMWWEDDRIDDVMRIPPGLIEGMGYTDRLVTDEELDGIFAEARDKHLSHFDLQPISDPTQDAADVAAFDWGEL